MQTSFFDSFKQWSFENLPEKILDFLPKLIGAALIIAVGYFVSKFAGNLLVKLLDSKNIDHSTHRFLQRSLIIFLRIIFVVIALEQIGISVNSFVTAIGAAGITAGLGLQNSIAQFAGGVQILFNKPFKSGDYVEIGDVKGNVREIRFMYTTLLTPDNKIVVIPNQNVVTSTLINYTAQENIRLDIPFSISYDDDIEKAKEVLVNVATSNSFILKKPKPEVVVESHGESSVNLICRAWCESENYWKAYYIMQEDVKLAFDKHEIHIPYNQLDIHIKEEKQS